MGIMGQMNSSGGLQQRWFSGNSTQSRRSRYKGRNSFAVLALVVKESQFISNEQLSEISVSDLAIQGKRIIASSGNANSHARSYYEYIGGECKSSVKPEQ